MRRGQRRQQRSEQPVEHRREFFCRRNRTAILTLRTYKRHRFSGQDDTGEMISVWKSLQEHERKFREADSERQKYEKAFAV